jgi:predicted nucleotidyltransferase
MELPGSAPLPLRHALERLVAQIVPRPGVAIALSGSIAKGEADRYSDADVWCIVADPADIVIMRDVVAAALRRVGDPITSFPATHLGADHLLVSFAEMDDSIVKIDVEIVTAFDFRRPDELIALHDPDGIVTQSRQRASTSFDVELANRRVAGWLWYSYTKAARGEVFEAIDALDTLRKLALVPLLLHRAGAPLEGYRRLERKLDAATAQELHSTFPAALTTAAVTDALMKAGRQFRDAYAQAAERDRRAEGVRRIERMLAAIDRDTKR